MRKLMGLFPLLCALLTIQYGCYRLGDNTKDGVSDSDVDSDGEGHGDADADADGDADADADGDTDADADGDTDTSSNTAGYQWHTFFGLGYRASASSAVVDRDGNTYVSGSSVSWLGPDGQSPLTSHAKGGDSFVLKLDPNGEYLWHTFLGGRLGWIDSAVLDSNGNIFVAGTLANEGTPFDRTLFLFKLSPDGAYQWHTTFGSHPQETVVVDMDDDGNLLLAVYSQYWEGPSGETPLYGDAENEGNFVLKVDPKGRYLWHIFFGGSWEETDTTSKDIVADSDGNVFVIGGSAAWNGPAGQNPLTPHSGDIGAFVLKLDPNGVYQWHAFYGERGGGNSISVDESGYLILIGNSGEWNGPDSQSPLNSFGGLLSDVFVLQLDLDGTYQWHSFFGSSKNEGMAYGVVDKSGRIFLSGDSVDWQGPQGQSPEHAFSGMRDGYILELNADAVYQRHTFFGGGKQDLPFSIDLGNNGDLIVVGVSDTTWNGPAGQSPMKAHAGPGDVFILKMRLK